MLLFVGHLCSCSGNRVEFDGRTIKVQKAHVESSHNPHDRKQRTPRDFRADHGPRHTRDPFRDGGHRERQDRDAPSSVFREPRDYGNNRMPKSAYNREPALPFSSGSSSTASTSHGMRYREREDVQRYDELRDPLRDNRSSRHAGSSSSHMDPRMQDLRPVYSDSSPHFRPTRERRSHHMSSHQDTLSMSDPLGDIPREPLGRETLPVGRDSLPLGRDSMPLGRDRERDVLREPMVRDPLAGYPSSSRAHESTRVFRHNAHPDRNY